MPRSFTLLDTLGEGAFGSVHLAEVREDGGYVQRLAVKWLHPHFRDDHEQTRRLRDEARLLALLQHEHIVRVHGLTRIDGRLAILMEPVHGADLSRLESAAPPRAAIEIVEAVADALDAAWETIPPGQDGPLRVVHRDIKPSNVMVTPRGSVKVLDFGVARATFEARESHTRSQQFGTARFMAPERWLQGHSGAPSDVFSLGVTLIEIASGQEIDRPRLAREAFHEDMRTALGLLARCPEIRALAEQMVAFEPEDRPTAREVAERSRDLVTALPAPGVREWAQDWVPRHATALDPTGRRVVVEDTSADSLHEPRPTETAETVAPYLGPGSTETLAPPRESPSTRSSRWGLAVATGALAAVTGATAWYALPPGMSRVETVSTPAPALRVPVPTATAAPVPAPAPAEPEGAAAPEPAPAPAPAHATAAPAPLPAPTSPVTPSAAPAPETAPAPTPAMGTVTFLLDPADLDVRAPWGRVTHRKAVELPQGVHQLTVGSGDAQWHCTVIVDGSTPTWRVDGPKHSCVQVP